MDSRSGRYGAAGTATLTGEDSEPRESSPSADLCVMVPVYNEEVNLVPLYEQVSDVLDGMNESWKFLFVDDGSTDGTQKLLAELRERDSRVEYIRFTRNFGLQSALAAGMEHAQGKAVIVMDADLQDDPKALPDFVNEWKSTDADVVYATRASRKENIIKRSLFKSFHWLMSALADVPLPRDAGSFALYDRAVVDSINALPERNRYLPGLRAWVGFKQVGIPVHRLARHGGEPAQSLGRLFGLALDGIFAFSKIPLRIASIVGFLVTALALGGFAVVIYWRFIERSFPPGVGLATIALSLLFLGGVQLLVTGIIGEYLGRVYDEVKGRPHYLVARKNGTPVSGIAHRESAGREHRTGAETHG